VWAEVEQGEEQARILSQIAQASEMHVRILQEELVKVQLLLIAAFTSLQQKNYFS
jgi:hypothetical protein